MRKEQLQAGVLCFCMPANGILRRMLVQINFLLLTEWFFTTFEYKSLFLLFHDQVPLIFEREIAIVITKEVGFAGLGSVSVCHIFKMKSKPVKLIKICLCGFFIFRQYTFKDLPVFQKTYY